MAAHQVKTVLPGDSLGFDIQIEQYFHMVGGKPYRRHQNMLDPFRGEGRDRLFDCRAQPLTWGRTRALVSKAPLVWAQTKLLDQQVGRFFELVRIWVSLVAQRGRQAVRGEKIMDGWLGPAGVNCWSALRTFWAQGCDQEGLVIPAFDEIERRGVRKSTPGPLNFWR